MTKKDIKQPLECDIELCCKATGELQLEVKKELDSADKALASLLEQKEKEADEDKDTATK